MILFKKLKTAIIKIDNKVIQMHLNSFLFIVGMFLLLVAISSVDNLSSATKSLQNYYDAEIKITETASKVLTIKDEIESLKQKLPNAPMLSKTEAAKSYLNEKIDAFNIYNGFGITAKAESVKADGISSYYSAAIDINSTKNANALVALIYFEKLGFIRAFDGKEMLFDFDIKE